MMRELFYITVYTSVIVTVYFVIRFKIFVYGYKVV